MVDLAEVFRVADKLRGDGKRVTLTAVRGKLKEGGSNRDICPLLADWKKVRVYKPRLELADMPAEVKEKFEAFSVAAWQVLKDRAAADLSEAIDDKARIEDEIAAVGDAKDDLIKSWEARLREKDDLLRACADFRAEKSATAGLAAQNRDLQEEIARLRATLGGTSDGAGPEAPGAARWTPWKDR
jgi:hypothetical protein